MEKEIISPEAFAAICYLVIMDHHGKGYGHAHPDYIQEKLGMLREGYMAIGRLDGENKAKVMAHLEKWGYTL